MLDMLKESINKVFESDLIFENVTEVDEELKDDVVAVGVTADDSEEMIEKDNEIDNIVATMDESDYEEAIDKMIAADMAEADITDEDEVLVLPDGDDTGKVFGEDGEERVSTESSTEEDETPSDDDEEVIESYLNV